MGPLSPEVTKRVQKKENKKKKEREKREKDGKKKRKGTRKKDMAKRRKSGTIHVQVRLREENFRGAKLAGRSGEGAFFQLCSRVPKIMTYRAHLACDLLDMPLVSMIKDDH